MDDLNNKTDILIIGGGAAGLFCGASLADSNLSVTLLEHNKTLGKKILISGGGRCNFTNIYTSDENFQSSNPHFHKSPLARYLPSDFIELVEKYSIDYYEKTLGQLFCKKSSREIIQMLESECSKGKVHVETSVKVEDLNFQKNKKEENYPFEVKTTKGVWQAKRVVVASGGLSFPKIGATDVGHKIAKKYRHQLIEMAPALVPLTLDQKAMGLDKLSGVSLTVKTWAKRGPIFEEALLFTHKGLSGPAILQVSSYWRLGEKIVIDFSPRLNIFDYIQENKKKNGSQKIRSLLKGHFPARFLEKWLKFCEISPDVPLAELSKEQCQKLSKTFNQWEVCPKGTEGYRKAEVTRGGVSSDEFSSQTLESKKISGLYFIGEVVDVTGWLGGYNFQWAWASAHACSNALRESFSKSHSRP